MSANLLTTGTTTLWTLTYLTPAATTTIYNLTLAYSTGVTTGTTTVITASQNIAVLCIITTLNFTLADLATSQSGFSFTSTAGSGGVATIAAVANWGVLSFHSLTLLTHTSDTAITTGASGTACTLVSATAPAYATYVHTYSFSTVAACTSLALKGVTWYARCFHKADGSTTLSTTGTTFTVSAAKNVTVGASTFAAGATILAGIAYLQF
jgi:hypothetical protein